MSKSKPKYSPISLEYFLGMELQQGGGGKEIIHQNKKFKKVLDVVHYFADEDNVEDTEKTLKPENWQYYNCMMAEFRHGVQGHHELGWENMTKEYYDSLDPMSDDEIKRFLEDNPVEFDNGFIRHNYHRACAMIGRIAKGKPYIPFYMKTSQIYDEPREHDGLHRIKPLTNKIKLLEKMDEMGIDRNEYCLAQSSILSIMNVRENDDLDIIISSKLRNQNIQFPKGVDIFDANRKKFNYFGAKGDDDILKNYCVEIDGYKFLEPRFYFARKNNDTYRDQLDFKKVSFFFYMKNHKGYPFNFDWYKWGVNFVDKIQYDDLEKLDIECETIIDKFDRVVNNISHGRNVYFNKTDNEYIKIFNLEYCRLHNFNRALKSGVLIGLCPSLTILIYNGNQLMGYICKEGEICTKIPNDFLITILRNCKKRNKIYYDIVPQNMIKMNNGQYSLIDLESVYDLSELDLLPKHNAQIKPSNLVELINAV